MENNHDIDKTFNEASQSLEEPATFPGFDKVWAKVEEKLDTNQAKKEKRIPAWFPYGIVASLLIAAGIFYFTSTSEDEKLGQPFIAKNMEVQKNSLPEKIQKTDSVVKANIKKEIVPYAAVKLAQKEIPKLPAASSIPPVYEMASLPFLGNEALKVAEERAVMDSIKRQNIEEVIAMGIKKEKASMNALASNKKISDLNKIADTADYGYPDLGFERQEKKQEPEILYKKPSARPYKPLALHSGNRTYLGEKQTVTSLNGFEQGLSINSISGASGYGRVDISVGYQANSQRAAEPLVIINGSVSDIETLNKIEPSKIDNISVISKEKAGGLFGGKAKNGLIVVITKDISKGEKQRLRKLLQEKAPEK